MASLGWLSPCFRITLSESMQEHAFRKAGRNQFCNANHILSLFISFGLCVAHCAWEEKKILIIKDELTQVLHNSWRLFYELKPCIMDEPNFQNCLVIVLCLSYSEESVHPFPYGRGLNLDSILECNFSLLQVHGYIEVSIFLSCWA